MRIEPFPSLCLDCGDRPRRQEADSCAACGSRRIIRHPELDSLAIAHVDCDAFYAAVEKRDDPSLADRPVIVGGGVRGVVTTACYIARTYGIRSAMPMFKALKACPEAVVIRPNFAKYAAVAREIRRMMSSVTPSLEPVSIDEAFLDLSGTARVHGASPAWRLAKLQRDIRSEIGVTVSVGLSCNKFLAKIASDFDKPNGFYIIGAQEAPTVLAQLPVSAIPGVGRVLSQRLRADGVATIADIQKIQPADLGRRYGEIGIRLARLAAGQDDRAVDIDREAKSVSAETTFDVDLSDADVLEEHLWRLCERVAVRMKEKQLLGRVVTLKLKTPIFSTVTRRATLMQPSNLARDAFETAQPLLRREVGRAYRLLGVAYSALEPAGGPAQRELFSERRDKLRKEEAAVDAIRRRFGEESIALGRSLKKTLRRQLQSRK
jgi:DNA polymerase-4